jgi:hypothetical protein
MFGAVSAFSVEVGLALGSKSPQFHITVPAPWHVASSSARNCTDVEAQCGTVKAGTIAGNGIVDAMVWTADPNAPAINVVAEPGPCR